MRKIKLLFQGDSITDAGRDRADCHDLGEGYPKYAAKYLRESHPEIDFEFIDLGISGNQTKDLVARLQSDFLAIDPDIVSILIGINDVWHHAGEQDWIPAEVFEERYRTVLEAIKHHTHAKIMMLEPFLIPIEDKAFFRIDLAREYADVYMPTDGLLQAAFIGDDPLTFAADGVHPTPKGADCIGKLYAEYLEKLL